MPGKDKLKKLHATLVRDGYDMPGYEEFEKDMADSAKLRKLHTTLVSDGYDMPDFEMFLDDMGYKKKDPSVVSGIGGEAGSFAGPSGKSNAQKVKEYVSALPGAKPKVLSGPGTPVIREEDIVSTSTGKKKRYRRPVFSSPNEYQADIETSAKTIVSDFERNNLLTIATLAEKAEQGDPISMQALEDFQKKTESLLTSEGAKDYASKRMAAIDKEEAEIEKVPVSLRDETQKARLAELVKERNSIQYSANRVIEHAIVSDALKKAIPVIEENSGDPVAMATSINTRNIGRQVVANTMKDMNDVLTAIEEEKGDVGPINSAFIDQVGINAISNVIASTPELQNENLIKVIDAEVRNWEASHPEIVAARAKHKVAAKLYKQGNWIYNIPPTVKKLKEIGDEMQGSGEFSPEEARAYREFVIPKEESLWWGTDIPMNGLLNKIGEGFQQSVSALGQLIDKTAMSSNSDIVYQASNAPADTRFQDVGEYDEGKQRLKDLGEKKTLTKEEQKEQADLKTYVGVRNRWNKIVDGSGGLAGQVLGMGMYSKALAAPLRATGKALTIPYLTRPAGKWLASDATALQVASIIQELPSKMEEYAMIFPKAEDKPLRMLYAGTSAYVVSKLEGIFDDRKVLDAFMAKATPSLKRFVREAGTGRVSKEAAATAWKDMVSALKTYSKEFVKEANNNAMEEAFQDMSADFLKGEDMTKVISRGFDTYTTTLMHSPLVAGVAAYGNAKSKAPFKAGLYSVAKDPSGAMEEVSRLLNDGVITKQEAKEKVAIIARASKMQKELPENIGEPEKAVYLLHRLNESLIDDQLAATTDEVLAKKLKDQKQRSMDIRQGIFDGEIIVGDNLSEMALTDSTAKKLLIDGPKTVDRDDAPAVLELITDKDGNKLLDVEQGTIEGEKAETWYRGVRPENEGSEDSFFSADKDIAGDYSKSTTGSDGKIDQLSNEELPKNPLRIGSKEDLADIIGYEGDPLAEPLDTPAEEKFDNLAKKYAQAKGHDAIIYESGTMDQPELHLFKKPVQSGAGVSVTAIDQKETVRQMTPIAEDMAGIELEFENNGFSIDTDYDNEIIITDKSGEIVDPEDLPAKLSPLAARYEAAASRMGEFDDSAREMALKEARKKISGDPADYIDLDKENSKTQTDEKANTRDGQKEGEKELLTPEENQAEQKPSSPSQKIQEWEQPRGPWKVVYENGKRVIKAKRGKKVMPEYITVKKKGTGKNKGRVIEVKVKNSEWTRLALQHAKSINYNQGETAQSKQAPEFNDPIEAAKWTIENSDNPAEIAMAWLQTPKMPASLSATEAAIANAGVGKVKQSSFNEFNDRNNITFSLAKTYFSKSGKTLDQVAQEASDYDEGVPVTPEDVANFMIRFPFGVNADGLQKTEAHYMAEKKFEELTGVPLAANRGTEAVANLAAGQFRPDLQQAALEQMPDNAADVDMQKVMSTEAFTGWSPVDVGADFDNLKNEQNDQAAENQSDSGSDGGQSGGQSETSRGNGTTEGGTGGSSAGRNGGQQGSGGTDSTEQPGAGAGAAEGAGTPESGEYTESDFLNEIQAIGPLGSGEEDMGDLEEAPFMAVSERSALQQMAKEMGLPATGTNEDLADLIRIGNTHPSLWSREDFDKISPHLAIHQDIRPGSEERVTSIVSNGLNSGMADSVSSIERGEHSWSGGLKDGDAYVFLWGNVKFKGEDNPAFAPGNKPMFHIKTKEGQSIFDALQTADNFRPEEPSMMAASTTEALLKEAEKAVGRAQRELSAAEDKIAKTKAQQGGMFGGATQGSMFSVDRDEAMDILNPLRVKLKQAREERDRLASKLRDEQSQADGQMSLFKTIPQSYPMATRKSFSRVASAIKRLFSRDKSFQGVSVLSGEDFQSAMSMTGATTPFNFIGGKSSFGAAMENKRTAEIMAAKPGADMEEIFKATGWYIDRNDRKWKFELPNNSRVLPVPVPPGKSMITKLDKVLDYPELYQAYPDAKNINVVFTPLPDTMDAAYNPKTNTILINNGQQREKNTEAEFELHQSIRHEVQHYIQHKEGFATGASKEREGVRERDRYLVSARDRLNGLKRIYEKMPPLSPAAEEIRNQIESLEDYAEMIEADMDGAAEYFYRAYAGEIEARNVEKRMRAATPSGSPNSTSDRAPQSHITTEFSEESFRFMSRPDGTVYGFVHKGTIYLNGSVLNLNTPIHEASHLFTKWAKRNNPELYLAGQRLAATSRMISQVKGQPFYRDQAERMRAAGKSESDIEQMFRDEALAFAVGNRGASIADADTRSSFRRWLQKFWDAVKRIFTGSRRLEEMTAEDFSNMTFDSLANAMAERILDGSPLKEGPVEGEAGSFMSLPDGRRVQVKPMADATEIINGFYSPTENAINLVPQNKMTGNQWRTQILSSGSKKDELIWTGLDKFLEEKKSTSLTREDVLKYLKDNRVGIVEVVKGSKAFTIDEVSKYMHGLPYNQLEQWQKEDVDLEYEARKRGETTGESEDDTKFSQYQLPGEKENYKEVLVTLPRTKAVSFEEFRKEAQHQTSMDDYEVKSAYKKYLEKGDYSKVLGRQFKSSHFDEPNILVHLRMNTRTDADGNKVLFLEEIQSDWGQKGKKEGFKKEVKSSDVEILEDEPTYYDDENGGTRHKVRLKVKGFSEIDNAAYYPHKESIEQAKQRWVKSYSKEMGIEDAPFVTDTNSWVKLGLKTALKEAVAQGADQIAWTTGEQQNERYDLSKQVDYIQHEDGFGSTKYVDISTPNGLITFQIDKQGKILENKNQQVPESIGKNLADVIGKDVTEKILNATKGGRLEGEGLKVGGKGMKGFYGEPSEGKLGIVGEVARSLFKQEIGKTTIQVDSNYTTNGLIPREGIYSTQHSITITPELRQSVEEGMPMFMATGSSKGMKMARAVQKLLANGHTEQQAKTLLMTSGYSDLVAENIISNAKRLPKYFPLQPNPSTAGTPTPTPSGTIKYEGDTRSWFDKKMDVVGRFFSKYFTVNKGMPELIIPLSEKVRGERDWEVQQAFRTVKELKAAAEKEGFTDWDKVDEALRNLKSLRNQVQLSGSSAITGFNPALAAYNRQLSMAPAVVPQVLQNLPASMRPIVIKMRDQIDSLTAHMVSNGYVSPELAMVLDNNIGEYMTRGYEAYNSRGWAKRVSEKVKEDALNFLYYQSFAEIKAADPSIPDADAELQAKEMATKRLQAILDGIDIEYSPVKTSVVKGRNNGILDKREDIPKPIRDLLGEYKDPGEAFMVTISKLASLKSQAKFLADVRDIGMGSIFWEANDPKRPVDASVELRSSGTGAWFPLGGLYTTREVAEYFNEEEYLRNDATNAWMKLVGAVRWGKTVGSVVTQIKNFESNIGFAVMNGHLNFGKASGEPLEYLWDQMKWWDGEKMGGELLEKASKLGLIGQNVGVRELQEMLGSKNVRRLITAASTAKDGPLKKISRSPVKLFDYLNKLYSASDDFFKLYGFVNERDMLSKAKYGIPYDQVAPQDQVEIDEMAAERVKNTYPTYDRVVTGAKYLSKNMPIFGNFLSFQAESIRVFMNTVKYAVSDIKNPETRSAGLRRLAGITTYLGSRTAILYALSQITGVGMNTFFGAGDDDDEQRLDDINRFTIPFTRSGEKLVLPNGPGRYTVYDITSVEPYGIIFKTMNAFRSGSENNAKPGIMAVLDEFIGPFSEREMTFEVVRQIWSNDNGKGARIYNPKEPAGNNFVDMLSFAIDKLEPSTIGFVKRMIERDNKANEIMAMIGARGYDLDVNKAFSIKIFKAEEEIAMMDKDYFNEVRQVKDGKTLDKIAEKYDNELRKVMVSLHADMRAAIRLGADATAIQERIGKAYKKVFDPYQKTDIQIILEGDGDTFRFRRRAAGATNRVD